MDLNTIFLSIVGLIFVVAAAFSYRKNWNFGFSFSLIAVAFFLALALPSTQAFLRTAVWGAFVTSVEKLQIGLTSINTTIDQIRVQMEAEQSAREKQQAQLDNVQGRIVVSQEKLDDQAERLSDIDLLVKAFYEKGVTDRFRQTEDTDRLIVFEHGPGKTSVYIRLAHVPIPQTVDINWDVYDQLSDAWELDGNIVTLRWRDPASNFYSKRVLVSYVPDPTQESEVQILRRSGNRVFADNVPMPFGYLQEDPVLPEFLNSREGGPFRKEEFQEFLRTHYANEPPKD